MKQGPSLFPKQGPPLFPKQGPSLFPKHSVYFCFNKEDGENSIGLHVMSCSPMFISQPGHRIYWLRVLVIFLKSFRQHPSQNANQNTIASILLFAIYYGQQQ
jgi:hypothetical protein